MSKRVLSILVLAIIAGLCITFSPNAQSRFDAYLFGLGTALVSFNAGLMYGNGRLP